jgi:hypothetical protein
MKPVNRRERAVHQVSYLIAALLGGCILVSCGSSSKNIQLAQESVGLFHTQLDTEQYALSMRQLMESFIAHQRRLTSLGSCRRFITS